MADLRIPHVADSRARGAGYVNWNFDPEASTGVVSPTSQVIHAQSIWLPYGQAVTGLALVTVTAGSGTVPGAFQVGLCSTTGALLAVSANLNSNSGLQNLGVKQFGFAAPYTPVKSDAATGFYYALVLENGAFTTTNVQFASARSGLVAISGGQRVDGNGGTGKTSIGTVGSTTLTLADGNAAGFWMGAY